MLKTFPITRQRFDILKLIAGIAVLASILGMTANGLATVTKVYWTDRNNATLSVTDLSTNLTQVLVPPTGGRLQDVDLDSSTGILYFADWGPVGPPGSQGRISQIHKTGGAVSAVCGLGTLGDAVHQLALDPANSQIYFTRGVTYDTGEVSRVNYGPGCLGHTVSFITGWTGSTSTSIGHFPSGLAHDPVNDILYWGDIGVLFFLPPNGSVNQMTASTLAVGPLPTQLTPHVNGRGRGMALHQASQMLFLTAHDQLRPGAGGAVFSYNIATAVETLLISDPGTGYWDIEIDPGSQRIWWTDVGRGQIRSAKFDGSDVQIEVSNLTNPYGLALELGDGLKKDLISGPDADSDGAIDLVVEVGQSQTTEYDFTINYTPDPDAPLAVIKDTVPAEWEVELLEHDDGNATATSANKKNNGKSATKIEWFPDADGGSITVWAGTRGPKKNGKFAPTSCGPLYLNDGAEAFDLGTGDPLLDDDGNPIVSNQLCLAAVEDVNEDGVIVRDGSGDEDGDGLTDLAEACEIGTDPCLADTDGDGVVDGADQDPLDPAVF